MDSIAPPIPHLCGLFRVKVCRPLPAAAQSLKIVEGVGRALRTHTGHCQRGLVAIDSRIAYLPTGIGSKKTRFDAFSTEKDTATVRNHRRQGICIYRGCHDKCSLRFTISQCSTTKTHRSKKMFGSISREMASRRAAVPGFRRLGCGRM
jgi:hypothetical protein